MNHKARKRFGQNFLHDPGIIGKIVNAINPNETQHLVEIGPGKGAITQELLPLAGMLDAVELDRDLIKLLNTQFADQQNFRLHNNDALKFSFCDLGQQLRIIGNLPYNISTPLLFRLLDQAECIADMHFMLQKEVVDRIVAQPGSKTYGRLSIMLQLRCAVSALFHIGPGAFNPPPKVDSAFIRLIPHQQSPYVIHDQKLLATIVTQAFSQRRKTLRNTLKKMLPVNIIEEAGIDPGIRAEQLSPTDFVTLANTAHEKQDITL